MTARREERQFHHQQSFPNSCQAACLAMGLARRSGTAEEHERRLLGDRTVGFVPVNALGTGEFGVDRLETPGNLSGVVDILRASLVAGAWVMVHVFGPVWVERLPPGVSGPHGSLCPPGQAALPLHAVLLVGATENTFLVLDPYHSPDGQPFEVDRDEFLAAFAGFASMVIAAVR